MVAASSNLKWEVENFFGGKNVMTIYVVHDMWAQYVFQ